jgi:hypothetical protein
MILPSTRKSLLRLLIIIFTFFSRQRLIYKISCLFIVRIMSNILPLPYSSVFGNLINY